MVTVSEVELARRQTLNPSTPLRMTTHTVFIKV